ncbi:hypothetical protein KY336_02115, partial [Candidatus Woesearchaeota archaeon]|nr:hypothetical protein [Candidatus Woesearchaeota archaeon]
MGKKKARKTSSESGLKPGIISKLGTTEFSDSVSYVEEVKRVMAGKGPKFNFPFLNQDATFTKFVSHLARSPYPYVVMVGEVGIGKTMMIDHTLGVLNGDIPLEEIAKQCPELEPEFRRIKERVSDFQHRDYLIIPNLKKPREPIVLDYTGDSIERDLPIFEEFCGDIVDVLDNFAEDNKERIRFRFREDRFKEYIRAEINQLYVEIYKKILDITYHGRKDKNTDVALVTVTPKDKGKTRGKPKKKREQHFVGTWKFLNSGVKLEPYKKNDRSGISGRGVTKAMIEKGLSKNYLHKITRDKLNNLMNQLKNFDVYTEKEDRKKDGAPLSWADLKEIVYQEFRDYNNKVILPFEEEYREDPFSQPAMMSELKQRPKYRSKKRISPVTLSDLESKLQKIRAKFDKGMCSPELLKWMDSVINYFKDERSEVEKTIVEMLDEVEKKDRRSTKKRSFVKVKGKGAKAIDDEEEDGRDDDGIAFRLRHGDHRISAYHIFMANHFKDLAAQGNVDSVIVSDFSPSSLFGTYVLHNDNTPPHMTLSSLGTYFQGGILVFPDHFNRLVKTLRGVGEKGTGKGSSVSGMRERFLESLQKGEMLLVNDGILFKLKAPRMILGCDNEDPFVIQLGFMHYEYDDALRDRIEKIDVPYIAENTEQTRAGTIKVIIDRINNYNSTERDKAAALSVTPEVVDVLLRETLLWESLGFLEYRGLTKRVDEIMRFAERKGHKEVSLDTLKELNKENAPNETFVFIDRDFKDPDGYNALPDKAVGYINSLAVFGEMLSCRMGCSSYIIRSRDPLPKERGRFELLEKEEGMTDRTANKGYTLATSFLNNMFYGIRRPGLNSKEGWQILTEKVGEKFGFGGDSSALAMTLSILSVLSDTPVYTNRFFTGTLQPNSGALVQEEMKKAEKSEDDKSAEGEAGQIGGVYTKALTPTRIHQLLEKSEKSRDVYFIFPSGNRRELAEEVVTDPFDVESRVTCIPV